MIPLTSHAIVERLRARHDLSDGWITMSEVTPPKCSRRFDVIAVMGWGSRGHEAMGFEIKVARSDWLRELKNPAKADPLARMCSRYWIVAPPGVVEEAELPPAWGLLIAHPEVFRTARQAQRLECEPWSDAVWRCMLLRCATRDEGAIGAIKRAAAAEALANREAADESTVRHWREQVGALETVIKKAQEATGVRLSEWTDFPSLGEAMKLIRDGEMTANRLRRQAEELRETAEAMTKAAASLDPRLQPAAGT